MHSFNATYFQFHNLTNIPNEFKFIINTNDLRIKNRIIQIF